MRWPSSSTPATRKPLVEGLVLKFIAEEVQDVLPEAPRGGAGIEMMARLFLPAARRKPLVEGLVLKS